MRKIIYISVCLVYLLFGVIGYSKPYLQKGAEFFVLNTCLPEVIIITLLSGGLASFFFPKVFPWSYSRKDKLERAGVIVLSFFLSCIFTIGIFLFINSNFGQQSSFRLNGIVETKMITKGAKGSRSYQVTILDSASGKYQEFKVYKEVYLKIGNVGEKINIQFFKGSLGIVYGYDD